VGTVPTKAPGVLQEMPTWCHPVHGLIGQQCNRFHYPFLHSSGRLFKKEEEHEEEDFRCLRVLGSAALGDPHLVDPHWNVWLQDVEGHAPVDMSTGYGDVHALSCSSSSWLGTRTKKWPHCAASVNNGA
jgi:hypothetical protein